MLLNSWKARKSASLQREIDRHPWEDLFPSMVNNEHSSLPVAEAPWAFKHLKQPLLVAHPRVDFSSRMLQLWPSGGTCAQVNTLTTEVTGPECWRVSYLKEPTMTVSRGQDLNWKTGGYRCRFLEKRVLCLAQCSQEPHVSGHVHHSWPHQQKVPASSIWRVSTCLLTHQECY